MTGILSARKWTQGKQNSQLCRGDSRKIWHKYDHMYVRQCQGEIYTFILMGLSVNTGPAVLSHANLSTQENTGLWGTNLERYFIKTKIKLEHTVQIPKVNKEINEDHSEKGHGEQETEPEGGDQERQQRTEPSHWREGRQIHVRQGTHEAWSRSLHSFPPQDQLAQLECQTLVEFHCPLL